MKVSRYYRTQLGSDEQKMYDAIAKGFAELANEITLSKAGMSEVNRIYQAVRLDYPAFYYVRSDLSCLFYPEKTVLEPKYRYSKTEVKNDLRKMDQVVNRILSDCNGKDAVSVEEIIHDRLIHGCAYGIPTSGEEDADSIRGALLEGVCKCGGISKALKYIADHAELTTMVATGFLRDEDGKWSGHAWNVIRIQGRNYHLDVTNDRIEGTQETRRLCFNLSDHDIADHYRLNKDFAMPVCPVSACPVRLLQTKEQLLTFLRNEAAQNKRKSEIRLPEYLSPGLLLKIIKESASLRDHIWINKIASAATGELLNNAVFFWR